MRASSTARARHIDRAAVAAHLVGDVGCFEALGDFGRFARLDAGEQQRLLFAAHAEHEREQERRHDRGDAQRREQSRRSSLKQELSEPVHVRPLHARRAPKAADEITGQISPVGRNCPVGRETIVKHVWRRVRLSADATRRLAAHAQKPPPGRRGLLEALVLKDPLPQQRAPVRAPPRGSAGCAWCAGQEGRAFRSTYARHRTLLQRARTARTRLPA